MTTAAEQFIENINATWDRFDPWQTTAVNGLSYVDDKSLTNLCRLHNVNYFIAYTEVMEYIQGRVAAVLEKKKEAGQ